MSTDLREALEQADEYMGSATFAWNAATGIVVLSRACGQVLGVADEAHRTGASIVPTIDPADLPRVQAAFAQLTPERSDARVSHRVVHPDRGVVWVETSGRAQFDAAGRMERITGTVEDQTTRILLEAELTTAHPLLHLAMAAGKSVAWDWDVRSGRDVWFGDLPTMFGIPSTAQVGHVDDFRRRIHSEDRGNVWKAVKDAMDRRALYVAEFRVVRTDGTVRWVSAQGRFYYSADGEPTRMLGIASDITERKAAEEALQRKDVELAEAQRLAEVGSWQWNLEQRTVMWSDELYRIMGRDPNLPPATFEEIARFYTPESWERIRLKVDKTKRTGERYELDVEIVRSDGTTRWGVVRGEAQRDAMGRIIGLRGTVQDVHERRQALEALRENEERLRLAAQAGRVFASGWNRSTGLITRSTEFMNVLGLSDEQQQTTREDVLGVIHPDDREKVMAVPRACRPEDPTYRMQYRALRPDGSIVWLEASGRAFFDQNGTIERTIGMVADITEHKRAEEAISALTRRLIDAQETERARIARDLHDDIGQRLALALVTLEQQKPDAMKKELRQQLEDIAKSIHSLSHELHAATLRYLGIAKAMRGFCVELAEQKQVDIAFSHHNVPRTVTREISLCLFRVLQEALHNAVRHSKVRRFEVELLGTSDAVSLVVRDGGVGFDPEKAMKGRGLGLISMQERLKLVNGRLSIDSQRSRGTAIHAQVPLDDHTATSAGV